jgi:hypothetical protein
MRKVIITNSNYLIGFNDLSRHAAVRKCWLLPRDFILFEMDDPVFVSPGDARPPSSQMAAAIFEEATFFAPFYQRISSLADIKSLHIPSQTVSYHLLTASRTNLQWPAIQLSDNWDKFPTVHVICRLLSRSAVEPTVLKQTLAEWQSCMRRLGQLRRASQRRVALRSLSTTCEFTGECGDGTMALFMLLSEKSRLISLRSVAFLGPDDSSLRGQEGEDEDFN